jgi:hypothetical protein
MRSVMNVAVLRFASKISWAESQELRDRPASTSLEYFEEVFTSEY